MWLRWCLVRRRRDARADSRIQQAGFSRPASAATTACRASTRAGCFRAAKARGYAGGILSAAVDGIRIAEAVGRDLLEIGNFDEARASPL
jgi:hypothetical protein